MTELELIDALYDVLRELFSGYRLMNKAGMLQEVKIFRQYIPEPAGITAQSKGLANYADSDYEANFPSIIIKLGEVTDKEENRIDQSRIDVKFLAGVYDATPESTGYRDLLNMIERMREYFLINRIINQKFRLEMPLKSRLVEADSWPVYFAEMDLVFDLGRPLMQKDFVMKPERMVIHNGRRIL